MLLCLQLCGPVHELKLCVTVLVIGSGCDLLELLHAVQLRAHALHLVQILSESLARRNCEGLLVTKHCDLLAQVPHLLLALRTDHRLTR